MMKPLDKCLLEESLTRVRQAVSFRSVSGGVILGSGLSSVSDYLPSSTCLDYKEIPALGGSGIDGHRGTLELVELGQKKFFLFCGRRHLYEQPGWNAIVFPLFVLKEFCSPWVLLTNAAGGVTSVVKTGELMLLSDHINLSGANPLAGPEAQCIWPERFLDQTEVYSRKLRNLLKRAADEVNIPLRSGVYAQMPGPVYETPAELQMLASFGVSAVGMSTAIETIAARAWGLKAVGLSCITNSPGDKKEQVSHGDVLSQLEPRVKSIAALFEKFFLLSIGSD